MSHLLTLALLLPSLWRGLAIESKGEALMRRHAGGAESSAVHLGPSGEFVEMARQAPAEADHMAKYAEAEADFCGEAYILGTADKNECVDSTKHHLILRESLCRAAAEAAGVSAGTREANATAVPPITSNFVVDIDNINKHPIGCFKDKNNDAFFYNPAGDWPTNPAASGGTPVCHRVRYQNASTTDGTCPTTGYARLDAGTNDEEENCRTVGECSGYCRTENLFRVGAAPATNVVQNPVDPRPTWAQTYNNMPKGCFIRPGDGCVYFNYPQSSGDPTNPYNTNGYIPVCSIAPWTS